MKYVLSSYNEKRCLPKDLEARCVLRVLGHLGFPHGNGAAGRELAPGPQPFSSHPWLHPALPGPYTPVWTLQPTSSSSGYSHTTQMATPWLSLWLSGAHIKGTVSPWEDRHKWAWRHLTGNSWVLRQLWSRKKSVGSGWSDFFGPWG